MGRIIFLERMRKGEIKMTVNVNHVADYFLKTVDRGAGGSITHLKLQKLVYYAQAWHLVFMDKPLFKEPIQAWVHGPVSPDLYKVYSGSGYSNLPEPEFVPDVFSPEQLEVLGDVWEAYGDFDGKFLEELTHGEKPWLEARKGYSSGQHCIEEISLETMKMFYRDLNSDGKN